MADKLNLAREIILQRIESGEWVGNYKLPAARDFAAASRISYTVIQQAFSSLVRDGILKSVPRQGTYVRSDWRQRLLSGSIRCFRPIWSELIRQFGETKIAGLRNCDQFNAGFLEIRTTSDAQSRQNDYLDLNDIFADLYTDHSDFFMAQFLPFHTCEGKLFGIPLMFSPTVIGCNPAMFKAAGIALPTPNWTWPEFLAVIDALTGYFGTFGVSSFRRRAFFFNLLFRAGGGLIERDNSGRFFSVLGAPETLAGMHRLEELAARLRKWEPAPATDSPGIDFASGGTGMAFLGRQDMPSELSFNWAALPLPRIVNGRDCCRQSADLICVRKSISDFQLVREVIKMLLSPEVQERIGQLGYGIPIRRSAAIRCFHENDPCDQIFRREAAKIVPEYSYVCPECYDLTAEGLYRIFDGLSTPEQVTADLAPTIKGFLKYRQPVIGKTKGFQ